METPFERGMGGMRSGGVSGNPMLAGLAGMANEPDYSQFTYDPIMRQQAIAAGVRPLEASQVQQNTILPNTGFFGRHPGLSRALEGAMYGAAATPSGGIAGVGENVSRAMEGIIGGHRMQQGAYRQQFARPFEAAGALEQLKDVQEQRELRGAQIKYYKDEAALRNEQINMQRLNALDRINATRPVPDSSGTWVYHEGGGAGTNPVNLAAPWEGHPTESGWQHVPEGGRATKANWSGTEHLREYLEPMGVTDPDQATPKQWAAARKQEQADKKQSTATGPKTWGIDSKGNYVEIQPGMNARDVKPLNALEAGAHTDTKDRTAFITKPNRKPSEMKAILGDGWRSMKPDDRAKALGDYYDKHAGHDFVYDPDSQTLVSTH